MYTYMYMVPKIELHTSNCAIQLSRVGIGINFQHNLPT